MSSYCIYIYYLKKTFNICSAFIFIFLENNVYLLMVLFLCKVYSILLEYMYVVPVDSDITLIFKVYNLPTYGNIM